MVTRICKTPNKEDRINLMDLQARNRDRNLMEVPLRGKAHSQPWKVVKGRASKIKAQWASHRVKKIPENKVGMISHQASANHNLAVVRSHQPQGLKAVLEPRKVARVILIRRIAQTVRTKIKSKDQLRGRVSAP